MLDQDEAHACIRREMFQHLRKCIQSAGRRAEPDNGEGSCRWANLMRSDAR